MGSSVEDLQSHNKTIYQKEQYRELKKIGERLVLHALEHQRMVPCEIGGEKEPELVFHANQVYANLGIGCELILKSAFLKQGLSINPPKRGPARPQPLAGTPEGSLREDRTMPIRVFMDQIGMIISDEESVTKVSHAYEILATYRNHSVHTGNLRLWIDPRLWQVILYGVELLYEKEFGEVDSAFLRTLSRAKGMLFGPF